MTTLLPVADSPALTETRAAAEADAPSADDRATFGALVDEASASLEPRAVRGGAGDGGSEDDTDDGSPDDSPPTASAAAVPPPTLAAAVPVPPPTLAVAPPTLAVPATDAAPLVPATDAAVAVDTPPSVTATTSVLDTPVAAPAETVAPSAEAPPAAAPPASVEALPPIATPPGPGAEPPAPTTAAEPPSPTRADVPLIAADVVTPTSEPMVAAVAADAVGTEAREAVTADVAASPVVLPSPSPAPPPPTPTQAAPSSPADAAVTAPPPEPWQQVAHVVQAVHRDADGTHTMTVRLDPPELGTVDLQVRVHEGHLSVHATVDTASTRDVLLRALPDLRNALESSGLSTGSLDVGTRSAGHGMTDDGSQGSSGQRLRTTTGDERMPETTRSPRDTASTSARLDLRL